MVNPNSPNLWTVPVQRSRCSLGTTHGGRLPLRNLSCQESHSETEEGQDKEPSQLLLPDRLLSALPPKNSGTISDLRTSTRGPRSQSLVQPPEPQDSTRPAPCWLITGESWWRCPSAPRPLGTSASLGGSHNLNPTPMNHLFGGLFRHWY